MLRIRAPEPIKGENNEPRKDVAHGIHAGAIQRYTLESHADFMRLQPPERPACAVAFEQLAEEAALKRHPELKGAYVELGQKAEDQDEESFIRCRREATRRRAR